MSLYGLGGHSGCPCDGVDGLWHRLHGALHGPTWEQPAGIRSRFCRLARRQAAQRVSHHHSLLFTVNLRVLHRQYIKAALKRLQSAAVLQHCSSLVFDMVLMGQTCLECMSQLAWSQLCLCCIGNSYDNDHRSWLYITNRSGTRISSDARGN